MRGSLNAVLVVANLVLAATVFRVDLLNIFGPLLATRFAGVSVNFSVTDLNQRTLVVERLRVGNGPSVRLISVAFYIPRLWNSGTLNEVRVSGLEMSVAVDVAGEITVSGLPRSEGDAGPQADWAPFVPTARLRVDEAALSLNTPVGDETIDLDFQMDLDAAPDLWPATLKLDARARRRSDRARIEISAEAPGSSVNAGIGPSSIVGDLMLELPRWAAVLGLEGMTSGTLHLRTNATVSPDVALNATANPAAILKAVDGFLQVAFEVDRVDVIGDAFPAIRDVAGSFQLETASDRLLLRSDAGLKGSLDAPLAMVAIPRHVEDQFLDPSILGAPLEILLGEPGSPVSLEILPVDGGLKASGSISFSAQYGSVALSVDTIEEFYLTDDGTRGTFSGMALATTPVRLRPARIAASLSSDRLSIEVPETGAPVLDADFDARFTGTGDRSGPIGGARFTYAGNGSIRHDRSETHIALRKGGRLRLSDLSGLSLSNMALPPKLTLTVSRKGANVRIPAGSGVPRVNAEFTVSPFQMTVGGEESHAQPTRLLFSSIATAVDGDPRHLNATVRLSSIEAPEPGIRAEDVTIKGTGRGAALAGQFRIARLEKNGVALVNGAVRGDAKARNEPGFGMVANGTVSLADDRVSVKFDGRLPDDPTAPPILRFWTDPIRYDPAGLQPGDITELADGLVDAVSGTLELAIDMQLPVGGLSGEARVALSEFSMARTGLALDGLESLVRLNLATPPATVGPQDFSLRVDAPLFGKVPISGRFSISEDLKLRIGSAVATILDGTVELRNGHFDPDSNEFEGTLHFNEVSIAGLTRLAAIDGVSGTGRISGKVPIRITDAGVSIRNGGLAAGGAGLLRVDNPTVDQALAGQHEYVTLMIDALKDFRYDNLSMSANSEPGREGVLTLRLAGNNPKVLDGQVFNINMNLQTDFNRLFELLQTTLRLTDDVLERARLLSGTR